MKKIFFLFAVLFFFGSAFGEWSFDKNVTIKPLTTIIVDSNNQKFTVTIGSVSNQYLCTSDQNTSFEWQTTYHFDSNSFDKNDFVYYLLQYADSNKYLVSLQEQVSRLEKLNEQCDIAAVLGGITAFKNDLDGSISQRFTNLDAKIQETYLPKQTEFDELKRESDNAKEGQRTCLNDKNGLATALAAQDRTSKTEKENIEFQRNILGALLLLVVLVFVFFLFVEGYFFNLFKKKIEAGKD